MDMLWVFLLNVFLLPFLVARYSREVEEEGLFVVLRNFSVLVMVGSPMVLYTLAVILGYEYGSYDFLCFPLIIQFRAIGWGVRLMLFNIPLTPFTSLDVVLSTGAPLMVVAGVAGWLIGYSSSYLEIEMKKVR